MNLTMKCQPRLLAVSLILGLSASLPVFAADYEGVVGWADLIRMSVPVSGLVKSVEVRPGQIVEQGATLLQLDSVPFNARVSEAVARRDGLVRQEAEARLDAERVQELYNRTVASDSELQQALIVSERAESALRQAQSKVTQSIWERDNAKLKAPFPARVLAVNVAAGEVVVTALQAPVLIELARAGQFMALVDIDAADVLSLALDQAVSVSVAGRQYDGRIDAITALRDVEPVRYRVSVRFEADERVVAGIPATVSLP